MIYFNPSSGLTVEAALKEAVAKAKETNDVVRVNINEVILFVTAMTRIERLIELYLEIQQAKYDAYNIKTR